MSPTLRKTMNTCALTLAAAGFSIGLASSAKAGFDWTPPSVAEKAPDTSVLDLSNAKGPLTPDPDAPVVAAPVGTVDSSVVEPAKESVQNTDKSDDKHVAGMKTLPAKTEPSATAKTQEPPPADALPVPESSQPPVAVKADKDSATPPSSTQPTSETLTSAPATQEPATAATVSSTQPPILETTYAQAQGFGKDIPLALALRDIVPPSYAYAFAQGSYAGTRINWQGGKPWPQVLNDALAPKSMKAIVSDHIVRIVPAGDEATPPPAPANPPITENAAPEAQIKTTTETPVESADAKAGREAKALEVSTTTTTGKDAPPPHRCPIRQAGRCSGR